MVAMANHVSIEAVDVAEWYSKEIGEMRISACAVFLLVWTEPLCQPGLQVKLPFQISGALVFGAPVDNSYRPMKHHWAD